MEKKNERVLAYTMAKTLNNNDLKAVSGGVPQSKVKPSFQMSAANISESDVAFDW